MLSTTNQVYQCLAKLIRWADTILLHGDKALNKENAHEIIQAVHHGIEVDKSRECSYLPTHW